MSDAAPIRKTGSLILSSIRQTAKDEAQLSTEAILQGAFDEMMKALFNRPFIPRKFHPRNSTFEPAIDGTDRVILETFTVQILNDAGLFQDLGLSSLIINEAYTLTVSRQGVARMTATSAAGGIHALRTFEQLFYGHTKSTGLLYSPFAPIRIVDGPKFDHRGLNLDIARSPIPPQDVLRVIDTMSSTKLNRLHIHASDAQSWPLEIPSLPKLAEYGVYDPSQIWTVDDLRNVQRHGKSRGVEVYIEIDVPGHTTSVSHAYPDLITAAFKEPWHKYAEEPPSGQLKLDSAEVFSFLTTLFSDLLPRTSPYSPFIHFGGDELNRNAYLFEPALNTSSKSILRPLVQRLISHVLSLASQHSVTPILWEEMLLEWNLTLPSNLIIQTWRSNAAVLPILDSGHRVLFGANSHWYLDCGYGTFLDPRDPSNPTDSPRVNPPYLDYCAPYHNWRHVYSFDPLNGIPEHPKHLILGGEVHLWSELTDPVTLDGMLWPRAAAAAEVLWRGPGMPVSEDTTRRLAEWRERAVGKGVAAGMVQMEWCLRNKGGCRL
ncbi:MAG: hypothetical protein Q9160_003400 [Pyrenula sp. 1 TL-2023]